MQTRKQLLETLKKEFKNHKTPAKKYAGDLSPLVEKYVWSTEPQYYMAQLKIERGRIPKGRILKTEPAELYRCHKTGYDKDGNVLTEEYWGGHPSNGYTKFFVTNDRHAYAYGIERDGSLDELEYLEYQDGRPVLYGCHSRYATRSADSYFYNADGKLSRIEMSVDSGFEMLETAYIIDYDTLGAIDRITRIDEASGSFPKGQTMVVYQKTAYPIKALIDIFTSEMVSALAKAVKANTSNYAMIAIRAAFSSDDWLPLNVHFTNGGSPLRRDTLLQDFVNPATVDYAAISTPALQEVSRLLIQQATVQEKYDLPHKLLLDITKKVKQNINGQNIFLIPADLYDDYNETAVSLLEKIYSKKELGNLML